jgi:hypothetical protein
MNKLTARNLARPSLCILDENDQKFAQGAQTFSGSRLSRLRHSTKVFLTTKVAKDTKTG